MKKEIWAEACFKHAILTGRVSILHGLTDRLKAYIESADKPFRQKFDREMQRMIDLRIEQWHRLNNTDHRHKSINKSECTIGPIRLRQGPDGDITIDIIAEKCVISTKSLRIPHGMPISLATSIVGKKLGQIVDAGGQLFDEERKIFSHYRCKNGESIIVTKTEDEIEMTYVELFGNPRDRWNEKYNPDLVLAA